MSARIGLLLGALVLAACGVQAGTAGSTGNGDPTGETNPDGTRPTGKTPLVTGLAVTEVAVLQAVKISVAKGGEHVEQRSAPVIAGRPGLVRVYVTPEEGWEPREVTAELKLVTAGKETILKDVKTIDIPSAEDKIDTTFNFEIEEGVLGTDTEYSVALTDATGKSKRADGESTARFPIDGSLDPMGARSSGEQLKIVLVPVKYNADQSGRLPDTSDEQIERYRKAFFEMYPAAKVDVTVRKEYAWSSALTSSGSGWSRLLQSVIALRQQDGADPDVYYMGVFSPANSLGQFCSRGCVLGLSGLLGDPRDASERASIGIGFTGRMSAGTAAHEVGHAHGRPHSPCGGARGVDPDFPHEGGGIGVWGYSIVTKQLISPLVGKDLMGYCENEWVSDYTYNKLFERISHVNKVQERRFGQPQAFRFVSVEKDGTLAWGDRVMMRDIPTSNPKAVTFVGKDGRGTPVTGHFYPYADVDGGYMLVPEPSADVSLLRIEGLPAKYGRELVKTF